MVLHTVHFRADHVVIDPLGNRPAGGVDRLQPVLQALELAQAACIGRGGIIRNTVQTRWLLEDTPFLEQREQRIVGASLYVSGIVHGLSAEARSAKEGMTKASSAPP